MDNFLYKSETYEIIGACMEVHKILGPGFLEAVYQEALEIEFQLRNIPYEREKLLKINYKDRELKKRYEADFVCYDKIIVELKAANELISGNDAQVLNYLRATDIKVGLLVNFGEASLKHKRFIY